MEPQIPPVFLQQDNQIVNLQNTLTQIEMVTFYQYHGYKCWHL